nr:porin [uncultured Sphingomonas sp.]
MSRRGQDKGKWAVAIAAASLLLPASVVIAAPQKKRPAPVAFSFDGGFTPAQADPRLAAALASRPTLSSDFRFTPSAAKQRPSQIRIAVRARATSPTQGALRDRAAAAAPMSSSLALTPASYNLGAAVGWKRFAVSADVSKAEGVTPALAPREGASVGVSYSVKKFTGRVAASADRADTERKSVIADPTTYALDVGGAYNISRNIAVTGGVKYKIEREQLATLRDQRRDSQAVYVGTAFRF